MALEHKREAAGPASMRGESEKHYLRPDTSLRHGGCQKILGYCVDISCTEAEFETLFQNPVPDLDRLEPL